MDLVTSALAEVGRVMVAVMGLREKVAWAVVVGEGTVVVEGVADAVTRYVAVDEFDEDAVDECVVDQESVLWVVEKVLGEVGDAAVMVVDVVVTIVEDMLAVGVGEGMPERDAGEVDVLAVAKEVRVCGTVAVGLDSMERVGDTVPVEVQPRARCETSHAHG